MTMLMTRPKPWKPPTRREYRPRAMDPGQRVSWSREIPARQGEDRGIYGREQIPATTETRTGEIWSAGPAANTWWVIPDGAREAVLVRRQGRGDFLREGDNGLYEPASDNGHWAQVVRSIEAVRRNGGLYATVQPGGRWDSPEKLRYRPYTWHADPECTAAAEAERKDGEHHAAGEFIDIITGRRQQYGRDPWCHTCVTPDGAS